MLITSQRLHGGVIDYFDGTLKRGCRVEAGPSPSKVIRICNRPISHDHPRITNRYRVVFPIPGKLLDARDHLFGGQLRARWELTRLFLSRSENLHVSSANIDNQHPHDQPALVRVALLEAITPISSFHELTKDLAPSSCSFAARSLTSTPAAAN